MTTKDLVLYDGDCGFCAAVSRRLSTRALAWRPWQGEPTLPDGVDAARLADAMALVTPDGRTYWGYYAFRRLARRIWWLAPLALLAWLPGAAFVGTRLYAMVAARRRRISERLGLPACAIRPRGSGTSALVVAAVAAVICAGARPAAADARMPPTVEELARAAEAVEETPLELVRPGDGFAVALDTQDLAGKLPTTSWGLDVAAQAWWDRTQLWPEADVVIWLTTGGTLQNGAFYRPYANDIRGIGYGSNSAEGELFDRSPDRTAGMVYGNSIDVYAQHPVLLSVFLMQELGHRWCCYLRDDAWSSDRTELLGRTDGHWSYFLDTGASPMEGNDWTAGTAEGFRTATKARFIDHDGVLPYAPIDLYTMGLVPADQVPPLALLRDVDTGDQLDLNDQPITDWSPPEVLRDVTINGTSTPLDMAQVIAANGARDPATWDGNLRVAFVLLVQPGEEEDEEVRDLAAEIVSAVAETWQQTTGDRSRIEIVTTPGEAGEAEACDDAARVCGEGFACVEDVCTAIEPPDGGGCSAASGARGWFVTGLLTGLLAFAARRRRRHPTTAR
jgi:predicted DCC family thiol-disulfide oxidoreductase YuxK